MPTVRYTRANGELIAEKRGTTRSLYVPDPLGSTVALIDNTQTKTDTWTYWPYGEVKTRTGTTPTPFQYIGTQGYYRDSDNRAYVRARHLDKTKGRWMTQDPIEFGARNVNLYRYARNSPALYVDPSGMLETPGLSGLKPGGCPIPSDFKWAQPGGPRLPRLPWPALLLGGFAYFLWKLKLPPPIKKRPCDYYGLCSIYDPGSLPPGRPVRPFPKGILPTPIWRPGNKPGTWPNVGQAPHKRPIGPSVRDCQSNVEKNFCFDLCDARSPKGHWEVNDCYVDAHGVHCDCRRKAEFPFIPPDVRVHF